MMRNYLATPVIPAISWDIPKRSWLRTKGGNAKRGQPPLVMAIAEFLELREFINSVPVVDVISQFPLFLQARTTRTI